MNCSLRGQKVRVPGCAPAQARRPLTWGLAPPQRDWVRLAFYVLDTLEEDTCFGNYMRQATTEQVPADFFSHSYGPCRPPQKVIGIAILSSST